MTVALHGPLAILILLVASRIGLGPAVNISAGRICYLPIVSLMFWSDGKPIPTRLGNPIQLMSAGF